MGCGKFDSKWKSLSYIYALAIPFVFVEPINLIKMELDLKKQISKVNNVFVMLRHLLRVLPLRWMVSWSGCCVVFFSAMLIHTWYSINCDCWNIKKPTIYKPTGYAKFLRAPSVLYEGMFHHLARPACHSDGFILKKNLKDWETFPIWWSCFSTGWWQITRTHLHESEDCARPRWNHPWISWPQQDSRTAAMIAIQDGKLLERGFLELRIGSNIHELQLPHSKANI